MENRLWGEDVAMTAGETITFNCTFSGTVSSPSVKIYQNKSDKTTDLCPAGTVTASGNIVTTKPVVMPLNPAPKYVVEVIATVDGNVEIRPFMIFTRQNGEEY
jgi:hypothetical protein